MLNAYLNYYAAALTKYRIDSPFVYDFVMQVVENSVQPPIFAAIERRRNALLADASSILVTDFGAGSRLSAGNQRQVRDIARSALSPAAQGALLHRLIAHYRPRYLVEMGTSLGITALYQATATDAVLHTLEGCPQVARVAQAGFDAVGVPNATIHVGEFGNTLAPVLDALPQVDYVFFDGNHRKAPTLAYFEAALAKAHEYSVFVFDDVHWSAEMEEAWRVIQSHPRVTLTLDLFFYGIVFFRPEQREKTHYCLIRAAQKPWQIGLRR